MVEHDTGGLASRRSILGDVGSDDSDGDASTATDANYSATQRTDDRRNVSAHTLPKEVVVSSPHTDEQMDYVFEVTGDLKKLEPNEDGGSAREDIVETGGRVRVKGTVGKGDDRFAFSGKLVEIDVPSGIQLDVRNRDHRKPDPDSSGWRSGYRKYVTEYVPEFYESVATKENLYRCVRYVGKKTNFWETLGKRMYLDRTVVTAAYFYPIPNYGEVKQKDWDGILSDMYADMPKKYSKKRKYFISVPVVVVYLYDGYYNAVAYLRPYGNYKSYGYAIKNGYHQRTSYNSMSDYESNTWWWTEDGWGDASTTEGGILEGVPTGLVD